MENLAFAIILEYEYQKHNYFRVETSRDRFLKWIIAKGFISAHFDYYKDYLESETETHH